MIKKCLLQCTTCSISVLYVTTHKRTDLHKLQVYELKHNTERNFVLSVMTAQAYIVICKEVRYLTVIL